MAGLGSPAQKFDCVIKVPTGNKRSSCNTWFSMWSKRSKVYFTLWTMSESESESLYDWRFTANQHVLASSPLRPTTSIIFFQLKICGYSPYVTFFLTRGWVCRLQLLLSRQRSHSRVRVPRNSWPNVTVSDSKLLQPGGLGPRIYIPQEQGGQVIPPGTGFPFRRLLWLAGLRWRYSTPPPHGALNMQFVPHRKHIPSP
jgi:hypothetical protein